MRSIPAAACILIIFLFSASFLGAAPIPQLDSSEKVWVYDQQQEALLFIAKGGRYVRGDLKVPIKSKKTEVHYFPDGGLKYVQFVTGNTTLFLTFYRASPRFPEQNVVASSRVFIQVQGQYLLHDYMRVFARNKQLIFIAKWTQGLLDGEYKLFSKEGKLRELRYYSSGVPVREWWLYHPNGNLASRVHFPEGLTEWAATQDFVRNESKEQDSETIYGMQYIYPQTVVEEWYRHDGTLFKKIFYEAYAKGRNFFIRSKGKSETYNLKGQLVRKEDSFFGKKTDESTLSRYGQTYEKERVWWGKELYVDKLLQYPTPSVPKNP